MIYQEHKNTLQIANEAIPIAIVKGKPNRVRLSFGDNNCLFVETSNGKLGDFDKAFLKSKTQWILRGFISRKSEFEKKQALLSQIEKVVPLFGKPHPVTWNDSPKTWFQFDRKGPFEVFAPQKYMEKHRRKVLYFAIRKFSELYLSNRVDHWAKVTGLNFNTLRIKELKTKWGSCSSLRNINLNWQLVLLSEHLIDYVIIHELMHLREMNHSPQFWALVAKFVPNYKRAKAQLKEEQWMVGILG